MYIGQTIKTIEKRWREHLYNAQHTQREQLLYLAMRKYGVENFYIELLYELKEGESIDDWERHFIQKWNSISPNGYNMTEGGSKFQGDNPMFHAEIRKKVSEHFIGDNNPAKRPEVREKIRQKATGKKASEETRAKMRMRPVPFKGRKHTPESRAKISQNHAHMYGGDNPFSKKVQRIDKDTLTVLEEYDAISIAIQWVRKNVNPYAQASNISQACHGRQKTAFGYIWKLVEKV